MEEKVALGEGCDFVFCEGSGVYFTITRYLHSLAECSCDDNTVERFCAPFIG